MDPDRDLADPVVRLGVAAHAERRRVEVGRVDAGLAEQRVRLDPQLLDDVVLEQPVDDDHVRAQQLLAAGDLLVDRRAVMDDELEVEVGDPDAGVAWTRRRLADVAPAAPEAEVAALDRVEEHRSVELLGGHERERRVAFELGQPEVRPQRGDDGADEVGQDVLRVVELDAGEVPGVPGDVGDEEADGLGGEHRSSPIRIARRSSRRVRPVDTYDLGEAARRSGVEAADLGRFVELGVLEPDAEGRFTPRHLRRAGLVRALTDAGIPLEGLGAAIRGRQVSLDFLDLPRFERFSALSGVTFAEMAERTGVPLDLLLFIREAAGSMVPRPDDRMRDEELPYVELIEAAIQAGFRPAAVEQMIRAQGDGMRRMAETESANWQSEVIAPAVRAGARADQALANDSGDRMSMLTERAVIAMYHLQQARAWTAGIIDGLEVMLADAGLHSRLEHPPAMCFLDISGFTRLTQERGDAAAAELAELLGRFVQPISVRYGGRAVKWLGDGVMLHFPNPPLGVAAALEMVEGTAAAGLPPAHAGLHAGPVIFQEGDYYGQTVNLASRIADYAKAGQVIVSQAVVDASAGASVSFSGVGPVELKGVSGAMQLFAAARAG